MLFLFCGFVVYTTGHFMFRPALLFRVFSPFSIVITSLVEERAGLCAGLCASRAFVCLFCTGYSCPCSPPLGIRGRLRLMIVALAGLFYSLFLLLRHESKLNQSNQK